MFITFASQVLVGIVSCPSFLIICTLSCIDVLDHIPYSPYSLPLQLQTSSFAGGLVEAISSLGSMSFGARNYTRCGEYVINSCLCYAICEIVFSLFWVTAISPIIILMGFDETVAELAQGYVYYKVAVNLLEGIEGKNFLYISQYFPVTLHLYAHTNFGLL